MLFVIPTSDFNHLTYYMFVRDISLYNIDWANSV